jgi:hypothetical protein
MTTIAPPRGYDWAFVGLTVHALVMIRTFAVYVNHTIIAGGFVRGVLASPTAESDDPWSYPRPHHLRRYGGLDVNGSEFLRLHRFNFQWRRAGKSQQVSLLGQQDGAELARRLSPALSA